MGAGRARAVMFKGPWVSFWGDEAVLKLPGGAVPHRSGGPPKTTEPHTSNGRMAWSKKQTSAKLLPKKYGRRKFRDLGSGRILRSVTKSTILKRKTWHLTGITHICAVKGPVQGTDRKLRSGGECPLATHTRVATSMWGVRRLLKTRRLRNGPTEKRAER